MPKLPFSENATAKQNKKRRYKELAKENVIHKVLPREIFVMILKKLSYTSINVSRETCKHWKVIIDRFELVKAAMRKYISNIDMKNVFKISNLMFSISEKANHPCIIVAGGVYRDSVEVLVKGVKNNQLPNLPGNFECTMMTKHNGAILAVGEKSDIGICLQLVHGSWKKHSTLNKDRYLGHAVSTDKATFIFGGRYERSYEFLQKGSSKWQLGQNEMPSGSCFIESCVSINSRQEIWLIGGHYKNVIIRFDIKSHTFSTLPSRLLENRKKHKGAIIPGTNKIIITGGIGFGDRVLDSTEIIDIDTGAIEFASPLNAPRSDHGIGIISINDENRVTVFGGKNPSGCIKQSVETYNPCTQKWEKSEMELTECRRDFGYLTVQLGDISKFLS